MGWKRPHRSNATGTIRLHPRGPGRPAKLDRSTISNLIRLLELPGLVQQSLRQGRINPGPRGPCSPWATSVSGSSFPSGSSAEALSVRQTERLVQETIDEADAEPLAVVAPEPGLTRVPTRRRCLRAPGTVTRTGAFQVQINFDLPVIVSGIIDLHLRNSLISPNELKAVSYVFIGVNLHWLLSK